MKCVIAQGLINKYINGELQGTQLEDFLEHIDNCEDCKEELEIYYVIMKGMQQVDRDNVPNYNLHVEFEKDLANSKKRIAKSNKRYFIKLIILELLIVAIALLLTTDVVRTTNNSKSIESFNGIEIK